MAEGDLKLPDFGFIQEIGLDAQRQRAVDYLNSQPKYENKENPHLDERQLFSFNSGDELEAKLPEIQPLLSTLFDLLPGSRFKVGEFHPGKHGVILERNFGRQGSQS